DLKHPPQEQQGQHDTAAAAAQGPRRSTTTADSVSELSFEEENDSSSMQFYDASETTATVAKSPVAAPPPLSPPKQQLDRSPRQPKRAVERHAKNAENALQAAFPVVAVNDTVSASLEEEAPKPPVQKFRSLHSNKNTPTGIINVGSAANVNAAKLQAQLARIQLVLEKTQKKNLAFEQQVGTLQTTVASYEQEIDAQSKELQRAGQEMETMRRQQKEDQDDILDDHDEELEELQKEHQTKIDKIRNEYETTIAQWKEQFEREQSKRQQEGGNWNQELEDAVQRERDALKKLHETTTEKDELRSKAEAMTVESSKLQTKLESALDSTTAATAREKQAQDDLDKSKALHSRQLLQRQQREAQLEQTIAELGSALSAAKQKHQDQNDHKSINNRQQWKGSETNEAINYKEQWEQASEELETLQVQMTMEIQRRQALQQELQEMAQERMASEQSLRAENNQKISDLEATVSRLQASLRGQQQQLQQPNDASQTSTVQLSRKLDEANQEISRLSDQVLRHQGLSENSKSEISALKGRLQAAVSRAEEAERIHIHSSNLQRNSYDMESGRGSSMQSFSTRRRIKGGSGRTGVRSIRSALRLGGSGGSSSSSPVMSQVIQTIDAVDGWMVDTGSFMRTEPFARLGFLLYLVILHVWSFALVAFHSVEVEHGDFGSMDSNPRHWRSH
ncbi:MAG: hypothetical protein SGARI_000890, partial [Bacillariaceae sp.]